MENNLLTKTTELAMHLTCTYIRKGDFVIDATCGNGHDTLTLARAAGKGGRVLAVDIQKKALESTEALLKTETKEEMAEVILREGSFVRLDEYAGEVSDGAHPSAVVFNLGYLPGGDKALTTNKEDTIQALGQALDMIRTGGIVTAVLYSGHEAGAEEKAAVLAMAEQLPAEKYHVVYASMPNQRRNPPEVLWITKKK